MKERSMHINTCPELLLGTVRSHTRSHIILTLSCTRSYKGLLRACACTDMLFPNADLEALQEERICLCFQKNSFLTVSLEQYLTKATSRLRTAGAHLQGAGLSFSLLASRSDWPGLASW